MRFSSTMLTMGKKLDFTKVKDFSPLFVVWHDIYNDEGGWKAKGEVTCSAYRVETLGWFMGVSAEHLMVCADHGNDGDTNTRMFIPLGCIVDWKVISVD